MNFYESEMRKMFGQSDLVTDKKFTGRTMLGKLDDGKLLKVQFISTHTHNHYDSILVSVIGKNEGVLDKETIRFSDVVGMYSRGNGLEKIEPHMWEYNGKPEWYTPLSSAQKQEIASAVLDYAEMYQDSKYALGMQFQ